MKILTDEQIQSHISTLYDRVAETKDELFKVALETKDNKINDLLTNEEVKREIKKMSAKQGRTSGIKWTSLLLGGSEIIRQLMENL